MTKVIHVALWLFCAVALAACMDSAPQSQSRVSAGDVAANVVRVDTSSFSGIEGRTLDVSRDKVASDISRALGSRLAASGLSNASVDVRLQRVRLTSPGSAFAFGGPSSIEAQVTARNAETGAVLFGPTAIRGTSEFVRLPGVIGAATSPTPERDYDQTVEGFAVAVSDAITGPASDT